MRVIKVNLNDLLCTFFEMQRSHASGFWTLTPTNCGYVKMCKKYRESRYSRSSGTISNRSLKVGFMGTVCLL